MPASGSRACGRARGLGGRPRRAPRAQLLTIRVRQMALVAGVIWSRKVANRLSSPTSLIWKIERSGESAGGELEAFWSQATGRVVDARQMTRAASAIWAIGTNQPQGGTVACHHAVAGSPHDSSALSLQGPRLAGEDADLRDLPRPYARYDARARAYSRRSHLAVRGASFGCVHAIERRTGLRRDAHAHLACARVSHAGAVACTRASRQCGACARSPGRAEAARVVRLASPSPGCRGLLR